jgi:hypothetical protein
MWRRAANGLLSGTKERWHGVQDTWAFFTTVSQFEHFSWLVVYGCSVYLPHTGHSFPFATVAPLVVGARPGGARLAGIVAPNTLAEQ